MKIAAINGSPRGKAGATWWMMEKFLKGAEEAGAEVAILELAGKRIHHCTGELACWFSTPGKCIHNDDVASLMEAGDGAEILLIATPVYVDGMTGLLKNFIDRIVSSADPHFEMRDGHCRHPSRKERALKRIALLSGCGFPEIDNFDPLVAHIRAICKNMNATYAGAVLRPAAAVFPSIPTIHPLFFKIRAISKAIEQAGRELVLEGKISDKTAEEAATELIPREEYYKNANAWFDEELKKLEKKG